MKSEWTIDPRLRVLFLVGAAVAIFLLPRVWMAGAAAGALAAAWLAVGLPPRRLARQVYKLVPFALFIVASYALTKEDAAVDRWARVALGPWHVPINLGGAAVGALMVLRVLAVVMASQVARAGDARAVAHGLGKLGMPRIAAGSIDAVLALLGGGGGGGGGGRHRGGGGGGGALDGETSEGFWASVKRLGRGDVQPIVQRLHRQIARAEAHVEGEGLAAERGKQVARDVAVISGIALTMLGIKALKVLPGIPFAPGYKVVILTPLYIVASLLTRTRFGATLTGVAMGTVAFLMGDGKYGVFEVAKHVAPGLIADAIVPLVTRDGRMPGGFAWSFIGAVIAVGRFATILVVTAAVAAPRVAYAILIPGLVVHVSFGAASGWVSYHLAKAVARLREEYELSNKELA